MNESVTFEQIQDYLSGELTGTVLTDFEAKLKSDPALKAELELQRDIDLALMDSSSIPFVQTLNKIHENQEGKEQQPPEVTETWFSRRRILRYAAAAAAVGLLAFFALPYLLPSPPAQTALQLSESSIGETPLLDTQRSGTDINDVTKKVENINPKMENGQYESSIPLLENLYRQTNDTGDALSLGYCHLQVKNYDKAITVFKETSTGNSKVKDMAMWYLAHTYLRKGDKTAAIDTLKKLITSSASTLIQKEKAKKLMHSIENIN